MNIQPIEKAVKDDTTFLNVHSIFHTIQGEGPFCGTPAVFIRLAGCNLRCPGCDTDYTSTRQDMSVHHIYMEVSKFIKDCGLVVITGGEPFRQNLTSLINFLTHTGYYVQVETNGTLPPAKGVMWSPMVDLRTGAYIVCSPKTGKVNEIIQRKACCFKYVLEADSVCSKDGLPLQALRHPAHPKLARPPLGFLKPIYLQPMDSKNPSENDANLRAVVKSVMKHGYILQLQVHKLLGVE